MDSVEKAYRGHVARAADRLMKIGRKTNSGSISLSAKEQTQPTWPTPRKSKNVK